LLLALLAFNRSALSQQKVSPCPSIFTYDLDNDSSDTWYGTLKLQTNVALHGITVDVIFDRSVTTFGAYYFNDVTTRNNVEFRVENKNFKLDPGRTLVMNIHVKYSGYTTPLLEQIRLNGQSICADVPRVAVQPVLGYPVEETTRKTNLNFK